MASAAVEMLALNPCRKMTIFNVDPGIDFDTDTDTVNTVTEVGGKRMPSEPEEYQDRSHVKKRRKQSKPVRIASSDSLSDGENFASKELPGKMLIESNFGNVDNLIGSGSLSHNVNISVKTNSMGQEYEMHARNGLTNKESYVRVCDRDESGNDFDNDPLLPINLSNPKCSMNQVSTGLVSTQTPLGERTLNLEKAQRNDEGISSCQETGYEAAHHEKDVVILSTTSSPLACPAMKPAHGIHTPNGGRQSGSPLRIFNPEAFCDLCNKEFCNKYFLKTHKANKHGIYSEHIGPNLIDALPSLSFINYFSSVNEVLPSNSQMPRSALRKPHIPLPLPQQSAAFLQRNSISNGNTRAFCNICQREFCNKYFVRRHKAKIHGIIDPSFPDTPPGESQDNKGQSIIDSRICSENHSKCEDMDVLSGSEMQTTPVISIANPESERVDLMHYDNKIDIPNDERYMFHKQIGETDSNGSASPGIVRRNIELSSLQSMAMPMQQSDEISKDMDSAEKMRRLGIANSEAFCEICCKEYCNKYFLRTHKMKSHGIFQTDCDRREDRGSGLDNSNNVPHYNSQYASDTQHTLPLNLIVGDQARNKIEADSSDNQEEDVFCTMCDQKFKNMFLFKMHTTFMHNQETYEKAPTQDDSDSQTQDMSFKAKNNVILNEEKSYLSDLQNSQATNVKCEICHKRFAPSLLEAHIENEHSNIIEELAAIGEGHSDSQICESRLDCLSCRKQFQDVNTLYRHTMECHRSLAEQQSNNTPNVKVSKECDDVMKNNQLHSLFSASEIQTAPTSSFCEICKKELCNKYFMKTHMQRMHGISIDNGAHIGGVVCDICHKELCSKYFLRVHKQNSHGIVDEILGLDISKSQAPSTDPSLRPSEQNDMNNRYFSHFTEVCAICSRRFRSMKWLKAHLLNDHGDEGKEKWKEFQDAYESRHIQDTQKKFEGLNSIQGNVNEHKEQPQKSDPTSGQLNGTEENNVKYNAFFDSKQYRCSYCPFSTSILAFLFVHERSHTGGSHPLPEQKIRFRCEVCSLTFEDEAVYEKHCLMHTPETCSSTIDGQSKYQTDRNKMSSSSKTFNDQQSKEKTTDQNETPYAFNMGVKCTQWREILYQENDMSIKKEQAKAAFNEPKHDTNFNSDQGEVEMFTPNEGTYPDNIRKEYAPDERSRTDAEVEVDDEVTGALSQLKESMELIANKTDIPVSFSVPQSQKKVIMQPFVLEDSGEFILPNINKMNSKKSFLSSIVFLPVKERLTNPVTVSFRLTPT